VTETGVRAAAQFAISKRRTSRIRAAVTGHLVFSTLHTNDPVGGITRLLDMDVEPFPLASVVKSFITQRLVRTICPDCVQLVDHPRKYLAEISFPVKELGAAQVAINVVRPAIRVARRSMRFGW
jgi:type II secretory ATPase GspE/PulE/Tfp pilus assembly ATPase PilB-like protein